MQKHRAILGLLLVLLIASLGVVIKLPIHLGLDLRGGSQLTIQVLPGPNNQPISARDLEAVRRVLEGRVNGLGVSEALVQTAGHDQILVQLPGVNDPQQAERVLGGTAQLEFRAQKPDSTASLGVEATVLQQYLAQQAQLNAQAQALNNDPHDQAALAANQQAIQENLKKIQATRQAILDQFTSVGLTGKDLQDAYAVPTGSANNWNVGLKFNSQGAALFASLTKELAGTGRSIGIFLDDQLISSPTVGPEFAANGITGGNAVITGRFTAQQATDLAIQLKGGALPNPVKIVENRTVGATLGRDSIQRSIYAGAGGLALVLVFMVVYYRLPGAIADLCLLIYTLLTYASFDLLGVTLTLPGIAGFILSIGMAVDANVLIFERTREELRAGKTLYRSVDNGFHRAFSSILDSHVTTLISCAALFWLGAGLVRGFALTLALGVLVSLFTAYTCSRTFLFISLNVPQLRKLQFYCPNLPPVPPTSLRTGS